MTLDQIEEHGLILAIQAAHDASMMEQRKKGSMGGHLSGGKLSASRGAHVSAMGSDGARSLGGRRGMERVEQDLEAAPLPGEGTSEGGVNVYISDQKPSAELFLLGVYSTLSVLEATLSL